MTTPVEFEPVEVPGRYAKAIVAILTAVVGVVCAALTDDVVTLVELLGIIVFGLNVIGVELFPMLPSGIGRWSKALVAVVGTALQAMIPIMVNGEISTSGWLMVLIAALGALSVGIVPNQVPTLAPVRTLTMNASRSD
jgi:hypothetical protein